MKKIITSSIAIILSVALLYSCKKDNKFVPSSPNNIVLISPSGYVPDTIAVNSSTLTLEGYFAEHLDATKKITKVNVYFYKNLAGITNSSQLSSIVQVGTDAFKSGSSATYPTTYLTAAFTGPTTFPGYNVQYNNYNISTAIPLAKYGFVSGDSANFGITITDAAGIETNAETTIYFQ